MAGAREGRAAVVPRPWSGCTSGDTWTSSPVEHVLLLAAAGANSLAPEVMGAELLSVAAAEVGFHDALVLAQGGAVALDDDLSGLEHVAVVGQLERDFGVLLDQQDGDTLRVD